ncbi:TPA: ATP-grasp fold amidoligase family protein [Streptococcus pneumoniae]|nr:glycosyl transferase [Streptococcus pneumoniae]
MKDILKKLIQQLPDKIFLQIKYFYIFKKKLNLKNPKTFNEKLQWLKLYNQNPFYTLLADKILVKDYIVQTLGEEYVIPTLGIYCHFDDIDFEELPNSFVMKTNHDSGSIIIVKNKEELNIQEAREKLQKSLERDYSIFGREWPYKNIERKIIIEEFMTDESNHELKDYKIYCFNGVPKFVHVDYDRFINHKRNIYDSNWNQQEFIYAFPFDKNKIIEKPAELSEMIELARKLSKDLPFLRCDFYIVNHKILFGELTFYPESGFGKFYPEQYDLEFGKDITLPEKQDGNKRKTFSE